jgi:hypothetical protein
VPGRVGGQAISERGGAIGGGIVDDEQPHFGVGRSSRARPRRAAPDCRPRCRSVRPPRGSSVPLHALGASSAPQRRVV